MQGRREGLSSLFLTNAGVLKMRYFHSLLGRGGGGWLIHFFVASFHFCLRTWGTAANGIWMSVKSQQLSGVGGVQSGHVLSMAVYCSFCVIMSSLRLSSLFQREIVNRSLFQMELRLHFVYLLICQKVIYIPLESSFALWRVLAQGTCSLFKVVWSAHYRRLLW